MIVLVLGLGRGVKGLIMRYKVHVACDGEADPKTMIKKMGTMLSMIQGSYPEPRFPATRVRIEPLNLELNRNSCTSLVIDMNGNLKSIL